MERFETQHLQGTALPLHRHLAPYVAVVLDGGYVEASVDGLYWCESGSIVVHPPLHAHANRFPQARVRVLNFPCQPSLLREFGGYRVLRIRRLSPRDLKAATLPDLVRALGDAEPVASLPVPALATRAAALLDDHPGRGVALTAGRLGVSREHLAREFRRAFGLSPSAYRAERRLRTAVLRLGTGPEPVGRIAHSSGFADHAHLTRTVSRAAGMPPSALRRWLNQCGTSH